MKRNKADEYNSIYNSTDNEEDNGYESNEELTFGLLGYEPPRCPNCGGKMKFNFSISNFKCFSCGYSVDEEDLEDELDARDPFSDVYDGTNGNPVCELCGIPMDFSYERQKFRCPRCASTLSKDDWELSYDPDKDYEEYYGEPEEDKPECCVACGGPYPNCCDGCKIINRE